MTEDWKQRWHEGRIGWHQKDGSPLLKQHWNASGKRVLVPMCGKARDLLWLEQQGNEVVGVELSEIAVEAFFEENQLAFSRRDGALTEYRARDRRISLFCGDYFAFSGEQFDGHFDRGALVAMNPDLRPRYAAHTTSLLAPNARQLVISFEYDQSVVGGPPFSVPAAEVLTYWPGLRRVEVRNDIEDAPPKFREAGLRRVTEEVWVST